METESPPLTLIAMPSSPQFNVRLPRGLYARLKAYCSTYGVSQSSFAHEALIKELDAREASSHPSLTSRPRQQPRGRPQRAS